MSRGRLIWRSTPSEIRVLLAILLIPSATSIASLSDDLIQWKGFILSGILLYQSITIHISEILRKLLPVYVTRETIDLLVFLGTSSAMSARAVLFFAENKSGGLVVFRAIKIWAFMWSLQAAILIAIPAPVLIQYKIILLLCAPLFWLAVPFTLFLILYIIILISERTESANEIFKQLFLKKVQDFRGLTKAISSYAISLYKVYLIIILFCIIIISGFAAINSVL